jgi:hypothetical protein
MEIAATDAGPRLGERWHAGAQFDNHLLRV